MRDIMFLTVVNGRFKTYTGRHKEEYKNYLEKI